MEKLPQFLKNFSKEKSLEERQQVAQKIKAKRAEHFARKNDQTNKKVELQQAISGREQILAERLETIGNLEDEVNELSTSGLKKLLNYLKLRKLQADTVIGKKTYEELKQQQDVEMAEHKTIAEQLDSKETPPEFQQAKIMLADFYEEQEQKWAESDYTKEDITKNFSEEHLSSLSLEGYVLLLKRFPKEMVAHVTRQGIRDHVGHMYHTANVDAYHDGFMKMVEDGRLRSPLGVCLVEKEKERAIARYLMLDQCKNKDEALKSLAYCVGQGQDQTGDYPDRMAIHFATERVADAYYGSEKGNEIFIVYPSAHIASQYYFMGTLSQGGGSEHNDQWVWANEEKGMDLNAGIIFIPEEAKVDKVTGSRYELDENNSPIENSELINVVRRMVNSEDFGTFADQVMGIGYDNIGRPWEKEKLDLCIKRKLEQLEPFRLKLERDYGVNDKRLQYIILDQYNISSLKYRKGKEEIGEVKKDDPYNSLDSGIKYKLREEGILFLEAKDTVSSREFWETYFAKNPQKRPTKVVYYKGSDPTEAFLQFRKEHGIYKEAEDDSIGFPEHFVSSGSPQALAGRDRFRSLAEKIIEDYFSK